MPARKEDETEDQEAKGQTSVADTLRREASNETPPTVEQIRQQQPQVFAVPPDEYRAQENARIKAEAAALDSDETVEGGRYKVNDKWVNANGEELGGGGEQTQQTDEQRQRQEEAKREEQDKRQEHPQR